MNDVTRQFYIPTKKEWAFRHDHQGDQTWYCDGVFDTGHTINLAVRFRGPQANFIAEFGDPQDKLHASQIRYSREVHLNAASDHLDIEMGGNRMWGEWPTYYAKFEDKDKGLGMDLKYECQTPDFKEPPDGCYVGRAKHPATPRFYHYFFNPKANITGTITIDGKAAKVKGLGYYDHQWGNCHFPDDFKYHYYWGKSLGPKHAVVWYDTHLSEFFGYERHKWLHVFLGDKLVEYTNHARMWITVDDLTDVNNKSGLPLPRIVTLMVDEAKIKGTITYKMKYNFNDIYPRLWGPVTFHRHVSECHTDLEIEGEKIVQDNVEFNEVMTRYNDPSDTPTG